MRLKFVLKTNVGGDFKMSLFDLEEICLDCAYANWHHCDECIHERVFCHCEYHFESSADNITGECKQKCMKEKP